MGTPFPATRGTLWSKNSDIRVWVLGLCTFFTFGFRSVLHKTWVLVRFVLAGFELFPISSISMTSEQILLEYCVCLCR